jgi:peroxiredoxin
MANPEQPMAEDQWQLKADKPMNTALLVLNVALVVGVLGLAFLVLGALRALGLVNWRLDQLEMTRPSRLGREGLKPGKRAPDFTLPLVSGGNRSPHAPREGAYLAERDDDDQVALRDFAGRKVLLVFTQSGCGPCHDIAPELNRLHDRGEHQVLVVNNGDAESTREWAAATKARFPVLAQDKFSVSKQYEAFATPFAFLIDEQGIVRSKGIAGSRQYLGYVLTGAGQQKKHDDVDADREKPDAVEPDRDGPDPDRSAGSPSLKEVIHA